METTAQIAVREWMVNKMSEWISTKDKFPTEDKQYLCCYVFGNSNMKFYQALHYYPYDEIPHFQHTLGNDKKRILAWREIEEYIN